LESEMDDVESRLEVLESEMDVVESRLDVLESATIDLESRLDVVESQIDDLKTTVGIQITEGQVIDSSGYYIVQNDLTGCIVINASNVTLDLNDRIITGTCDPIIQVISGNTNVTIKNGTLDGVDKTRDGIGLGAGADDSTIFDVTIINCAKGIEVNSSNNGLFELCIMKNCDTHGLDLINSGTCEVKYCQVLDVDTTGEFTAFHAYYDGSGGNVTFFNCIAKNLIGTFVIAFDIEDNNPGAIPDPTDFIIDGCIIGDIQATTAYGIKIEVNLAKVTNNQIFDIGSTIDTIDSYGILAVGSRTSYLYAHNNLIKNLSSSFRSRGIYTTNNNNHYLSGNMIQGLSSGGTRYAIQAGGVNTKVIGNMSVDNGGAPFNGGDQAGNSILV